MKELARLNWLNKKLVLVERMAWYDQDDPEQSREYYYQIRYWDEEDKNWGVKSTHKNLNTARKEFTEYANKYMNENNLSY